MTDLALRRMSVSPQNQYRRRGAILPLIAVLLPVLLILVAMIVNIAYMELTRTELRISTDAAARAAGRELTLTGDIELAKVKGRDAASRNLVAGEPLQLADSDFDFGFSNRPDAVSRYGFSSDPSNPNAILIRGRRTDTSPGGPVDLFFPNVLGMGQFEPVQEATSTRIELDISIVIDRSGSMAYADTETADPYNPPAAAPEGWAFGDAIPPDSRWLDVINGTQVFLNALNATPQAEQVALATYAETSTADLTLTSDYSALMNSLNLYTQAFYGGGTNIYDGIGAGLLNLADAGNRSWASKVIIVMTDGNYNVGPHPIHAAYTAKANNVTVYTITFSSEAGQYAMRSVANKTGGAHYHAVTGAELAVAFQDIASRLPTLLTH